MTPYSVLFKGHKHNPNFCGSVPNYKTETLEKPPGLWVALLHLLRNGATVHLIYESNPGGYSVRTEFLIVVLCRLISEKVVFFKHSVSHPKHSTFTFGWSIVYSNLLKLRRQNVLGKRNLHGTYARWFHQKQNKNMTT